MEEIVGTYDAKTPSGEAVTLYEVRESLDAGTSDEPNRRKPGAKRMQLADGRVLTMVGRGEYKITGTNEVFLVCQ